MNAVRAVLPMRHEGELAAATELPWAPIIAQAYAASQPRVYASRLPDDPPLRVQSAQPAPPPELRRAAKAALPAVTAALAEPSAEAIRGFLLALNVVVAKPLDEATFQLRVIAAVSDFRDIPAGVWTQATATAARRSMRWFPSGAELSDFLVSAKSELERRASFIRRCAGVYDRAAEAEPEYVRPSRDEREAILARFRSQLPGRHPDPEPNGPGVAATNHVVSNEALRGIWTQEAKRGNPGAAARLRALEAATKRRAKASTPRGASQMGG